MKQLVSLIFTCIKMVSFNNAHDNKKLAVVLDTLQKACELRDRHTDAQFQILERKIELLENKLKDLK